MIEIKGPRTATTEIGERPYGDDDEWWPVRIDAPCVVYVHIPVPINPEARAAIAKLADLMLDAAEEARRP